MSLTVKKVQEVLKNYVIKTLLGGNDRGVHKTTFTIPYGDNIHETVIEFEIIKIPMWRVISSECMYEGTIYVHINEILVGDDDSENYESMSKDDIPSWVWDDLIDDQFLKKLDDTGFCFDVSLDFPNE
jgi:hypothetical protein